MTGVSIHNRFLSMSKVSRPQLTLVATALLVAVATIGCTPSPDANQPAAPATPAQPAAVESGMMAPLTQEQVGARYSVAGTPVLINEGRALRITVSVANTGSVAISSKGDKPVNLAISLVDGTGAVVAQDFVRVALPDDGIAAGASAEVVAEVPVQDVLGKSLKIGLVQETVAWFSDFKVESLDYGPLTTCEDQGKQAVCKDGVALPHAEQP